MIKNQQELYLETKSLEGNINRMCVTDNAEELEKMKAWAISRIERIFQFNSQRILEKQDATPFKVRIYSHYGDHIRTERKATLQECVDIWNERCDEGFPAPTIWKYNEELKDYERVMGY